MSSMVQTPFSEATFRQACGQFATGVAVATACGPAGEPHGLTINSFTSVSLAPPLVLICIDYRAQVLQVFLRASQFAVNILRDSQQEISNRFAYRVEDRFCEVSWKPGQTGAPILDGALASIECVTRQVIDAGDHTILLGEAVAVHAGGGDPLLYFNSKYHRIG
ncbi:MAG: flavin reductase family protein [Bryobacterales bacterium]|nr:flavin reductase family protein [Bryobacterales bacterium]